MMKAQQLLDIICKYYGINDIRELGAARLSTSSWRYPIIEEARQIACFMVQKHCPDSLEEVQKALKELQLSGMYIRTTADRARRLVTENVGFRVSTQAVEQMIVSAINKKRKG